MECEAIEIEDEIQSFENEFVMVDEIPEPPMEYVGEYDLTAYESTGRACADGEYPQINYTVASNNDYLWHKWIYIAGYGLYYVHDTGGMSKNTLDIYMGDYNEAINFGRQRGDVYIVELD